MMSLPVWLLGPMFLLGGLCLWSHAPLGGLRGLSEGLCPGVFVGGGGYLSWENLSRGVSVEGVSVKGGLCLGDLCRETSLESENWVVHILLECFLVS